MGFAPALPEAAESWITYSITAANLVLLSRIQLPPPATFASAAVAVVELAGMYVVVAVFVLVFILELARERILSYFYLIIFWFRLFKINKYESLKEIVQLLFRNFSLVKTT